MRKIKISLFALFAVFAFSAVGATSAFAEAKWLVGGVEEKSGEELASETEGELHLIQYESSTSTAILTEIDCSGIFDGFIVGPNLALITDLLNLLMEEIGNLEGDLNTLGLDCETLVDGGAVTDCLPLTLSTIWPDKLSLELSEDWTIEFEEMPGGLLLGIFPLAAGYHVECPTLFSDLIGENLCVSVAGHPQTFMWMDSTATSPPSVLGELEKLEHASERGECEVGGKEVAEIQGSGNTWAIEGELNRLETALN